MKPYTPEEDQIIRVLVMRFGARPKVICRFVGRSQDGVQYRARRLGFSFREARL